MPRKTNRRTPPESKHHLDHWAEFCRKTIAESKKKMETSPYSNTNKKSLPEYSDTIKKGYSVAG